MTTEFPLPDLEFEPTRGFWEAAQRERLAIPRCSACGAYNWYPEDSCKHCAGPLTWSEVSGDATLFKAYASQAPYLTGLVALVEDPSVRLATRLVDCSADDLVIDMPVRVAFRPLAFPDVRGRVMAPLFKPVLDTPPDNPNAPGSG